MTTQKNTLEITILGSGTCVPSLTRSSCALLVTCGADKIVFDMGPGTMGRILEAGTRIEDISYVCLSHFHPDHCGELVPYLFALKARNMLGDKGLLTLIGGRGLIDFFKGLKRVFGRWIDLGENRLRLVELDTTAFDEMDFGSFHLSSAPVVHNPESIAYRLRFQGKSMVYSGDTDKSDNLITLSQDADVLVCESAGTDENKLDKHLTPSLAGDMASRARVKRLVLTHFYPECEKTDIAKQCRNTYDGKLLLAEDLMKITL